MTNRLDRWKRRAPFALLFVLMLPSLAGCTSGMSALGEPPAASDIGVDPWPRQLTSRDNTFSVFQPQYESWDQGRLSSRAAVAVEDRVSSQAKYGVIWFTARTEVDKETRMVTLEDVTVSKADFPTTPDGGAAYLAALPKKKRHNIRYALRDFDAFAGGEVELRCARTAGEAEEAFRVLLALHAERWAGAGRQGVFEKPRFLTFHGLVQPLLLGQDALQLLWLSVRGEALAAMYNIVWDNKVYFYQCGRKYDLPPKVSPGTVLIARALQKAMAEGRREFDFLAGVSQYKMQFAGATRPLVQVRAAWPSPRESARRLLERGADWARRLRGRRTRPAADDADEKAGF